MTLTCPTCGKPRFNRIGEIVVTRLLASDKPMTAKEILAGTSVSSASWKAVSNRMRGPLAASGYQLVNVVGLGPWQARYRLLPVKEK
jgi:hypothetical protein